MSFVARVSRTLKVSDLVAYDCLSDQDAWARWMPDSFTLIGPSVGPLREGAKFRVRLQGVPFPVGLEVTVARRPAEITWCGGLRGLLWARHQFVFERRSEQEVEVHSVETWSGALSPLLRRVVKPRAERGGRAQLAGLERGVS